MGLRAAAREEPSRPSAQAVAMRPAPLASALACATLDGDGIGIGGDDLRRANCAGCSDGQHARAAAEI